MPIYEFHCEKCERDSELLIRSADWTGAKCPHCGSAELEKKFSTFAATGENSSGQKSGGGHGCGGACSCH